MKSCSDFKTHFHFLTIPDPDLDDGYSIPLFSRYYGSSNPTRAMYFSSPTYTIDGVVAGSNSSVQGFEGVEGLDCR